MTVFVKENKRGRRFCSLKNANAFAKMLKVDVIDLRENKIRKSDFIVKYTNQDIKNVSILEWDNQNKN